MRFQSHHHEPAKTLDYRRLFLLSVFLQRPLPPFDYINYSSSTLTFYLINYFWHLVKLAKTRCEYSNILEHSSHSQYLDRLQIFPQYSNFFHCQRLWHLVTLQKTRCGYSNVSQYSNYLQHLDSLRLLSQHFSFFPYNCLRHLDQSQHKQLPVL